ncbi:hypothetical protein WMF30_15270 [Sorangium sp. So ce134]
MSHGSTTGTIFTNSERFTYTVPSEEGLTIACTLQNDGADTGISVAGRYACQAGSHASLWTGTQYEMATVELVHDFKSYIEDAARRTGSNGVSARFIASVLCIEIANRPRRDRQGEVEDVREEIAELTLERHRRNIEDLFNANFFLDVSFGVGQMKMSTLAMALRMIPLIEQDRNDSRRARERINEEFMKLTTGQMWHLWKLIRWPKSHIDGVAKLLTFLKNREKRYPSLDRASFAGNRRAMAIVATEYNRGATSTPEASAGATWYGDMAASTCLDRGTVPILYDEFSHA